MTAHARTLEELGWPRILDALSARCRTAGGKARAAGLPFLDGPAEVREALARMGEARALSESRTTLPISTPGEPAAALERAGKGGVLEPLALRDVAALARSAARTRAALSSRQAEMPRLWALAEPLSDGERLADRIDAAIEPSGVVSERASPELSRLRDRARGLHRSMKVRIEELLVDDGVSRHLRDGYFTIRNERYVLPVLASSRAAVPGIVHNASQSGQTLFVEPDGMVEMGNELAIANAMAAEEEERILRDLTEGVTARAAELTRDLAILSGLDLLEGQALFASDLDATAPEVVAPGEGIALRDLRHPILVLQKKKVVSSDLRLEPPARTLVVSGPNGGGKTVAVTAVGLSALLLKAGLPIAAGAGSRLPFYPSVRAAVEEHGDLARDLSTFTAHLTAVRDICEVASPGALVLVDEIAADTDPREGAALAAALLEDLLERGATVLVTTHLDELKALALSDPRYANARVGFDPERLAPTFQLHLGSPGSSSAIEVARRVGLPEKVIERARASLSGRGGALGEALRSLSAERSALEAQRAELAREAEGAHRREEAARRREEGAFRAEKEAAARVASSLAEEVEEARDEVRRVLAALHSAPTVKKASETARQLEEWAGSLERSSRVAASQAAAAPEAAPDGALEPGVRVRVASLGQEGEVLELQGDEAVVQLGALRIRRPRSDLLPLRGKARAAPLARSRQDRMRAAEESRPAPVTSTSNRLDVRGMRAEEMLREVERFLDRVVTEGAMEVFVLHGHGTGALKESLRVYLRESPYVAEFRKGNFHEGGDAVTLLTLRR
ncbi:MAG: Smr/MutS family protein [Deltaproteobacteria bacterium]